MPHTRSVDSRIMTTVTLAPVETVLYAVRCLVLHPHQVHSVLLGMVMDTGWHTPETAAWDNDQGA